MPEKDISDKELDAMIDDSIKQGEAEKAPAKKESAPKEKEAKPAKEKPREESAAKESKAKEEKKPEKTSAGGIAVKPKAKKDRKEAALKPVEGYNPWDILTYPHLTEKSMNLVERNNVLVFIVNMKATKAQVKEAVEKGFGARVVSVRLHITRKNQKKAYIRLAEGALASDIATRLGMI